MPNQFLEQFMAGWQMGQGRNESRRRDQELQMEQARQAQMAQQQAIDNDMRREHWNLQKKTAELEMKRAEFDAKAQAAAMMSRNQEVLPPQTEDLGGATSAAPSAGVLEIGPVVQPRPQMTAQIPGAPEGTPAVPLPFMEDIQALKDADSRRKIQEALGLKVLERQAMEPFEQAKFDREAGLRRELAGQRAKEVAKVLGAFGTAKSEGQQNKVEIAQYAVGKMPSWQKFIDTNRDKFGFYAGRATKVAQSGALRPLGVKPSKEMGKFSSELSTMSSAMLNALSGAAISPQEFERLKQFIPQIEDEPEMLQAKMATLDDYFKFRLKNFNAPWQGPGWQENSPPTAPAPGVNPSVAPLLSMYGVDIFSGEE